MSAEILKNIYLFEDMNENDLEALSGAVEIEKKNKGEMVFRQGEEAAALFVIKSGSVKIFHADSDGNNIEISVLGPGSHFGEMAFLDQENRSASVEATEPAEILRIDYSRLKDLLSKHSSMSVSFYKSLAGFLCGRLRTTTTDLSFSRQLNLRHF